MICSLEGPPRAGKPPAAPSAPPAMAQTSSCMHWMVWRGSGSFMRRFSINLAHVYAGCQSQEIFKFFRSTGVVRI